MEPRDSNNGNNKNKPAPPGSVEPVFRSAVVSPVFQQPSAFALIPEPGPKLPASSLTTSPLIPWGWRNPRLTSPGLYYPLGPCQVRLSAGRLADVLGGLPDTFRKLSLQADFVDTPISAICKSLDQVEFQVSIFTSFNNPGEMVVEIERKDGDVILYHNYACQVVRAITGAGQNGGLGQEPVAPCFWNRGVLVHADDIRPGAVGGVAEALETAFNLMMTGRLDARRLGFESVVHMTDPYKCGVSVARIVSEALLHPKNETQQRISNLVFHHAFQVQASENRNINLPSFAGYGSDDFSYLALIIVCQVFQVAADSKTIDVESFLSAHHEDMVECIIEKVHQVHSHPHEAYYAVQTLVALCDGVPSLRARINNRDVEEAQHYGDSCHLALATASHKLLLSLQA